VFENLQKAGVLLVQQQALWKLLIQRDMSAEEKIISPA
jgi:hypothetical protein